MNIFVFCKKLLEIEHVLPEGFRSIDEVCGIKVSKGKITRLGLFSSNIKFEPLYNIPNKIVVLSVNNEEFPVTEEELSDISTVCLSYPHQQNFPILDLVSKRLVNDGVFLS